MLKKQLINVSLFSTCKNSLNIQLFDFCFIFPKLLREPSIWWLLGEILLAKQQLGWRQNGYTFSDGWVLITEKTIPLLKDEGLSG